MVQLWEVDEERFAEDDRRMRRKRSTRRTDRLIRMLRNTST